MKKILILSLIASTLIVASVFALGSKREYNMVRCGYMSQSEAETGAGYASTAAWYLGATTVSTHSYEMGPSCHGCPSEYCFQIHWTVNDPELNTQEINNLISMAIEKSAGMKIHVERFNYLEGVRKQIESKK